jgi:hypothetical protein
MARGLMLTVTVANGSVIGLTASAASAGIDWELRSWCHGRAGRGRLPPVTATPAVHRPGVRAPSVWIGSPGPATGQLICWSGEAE